MGLGLRAINRFAGLPMVDRLGLRKPAQQALYHGARIGFRGAGAVARSFQATQKLLKPARLSPAANAGLFDLTPTDEQQMLREAALSFALERMRPAAQAADAAGAAPAEILAGINDLGVGALSIPEALGGVGGERSVVGNVLIAEALAQGDMGLAVAGLAPVAVSTALVLWGDPTQQATYLPAFVGERPPAAALAVLEPRPLFDPLQLQTVARRSGDGYTLDGVKVLVPRGAEAELFIVAARLEGAGPALFIVESSNAGLSVEADPAMGLRAAATTRLHLDGVKLPAAALIGGGAAEVYRDCIRLSRIGWCALAVGTAQAALDYVIPYVNERVAFGEPISHRQSVAFAVANIGIELEGMRLATWRAASRAEQGLDHARETALARRLCADKAMGIGSDAVQLLGGHGFVKEHPVERWYRDLRATGVMEGVVLV
ncbi:acyl-CoA dehydrogenase family protein [Fontimonas sp. SYSU GA230001]|uniref:acyl-CoA dehydrogenase family protein n=1 Tax=Fontimonas sp. SYSU GA230001 TaxID=3142450 RepID=UPI0032B45922